MILDEQTLRAICRRFSENITPAQILPILQEVEQTDIKPQIGDELTALCHEITATGGDLKMIGDYVYSVDGTGKVAHLVEILNTRMVGATCKTTQRAFIFGTDIEVPIEDVNYNSDFRDLINQLNADYAALERKVEDNRLAAEQAHASLSTEVSDNKTAIEERAAAIEAAAAALKQKVDDNETDIEGKISAANDNIAQNTSDIESLQATVASNKTEIEGTVAELDAREAANKQATDTEIDALKQGKADKATTLAGYGIGDAYTKSEVDGIVASVYKYRGTKATYADLPAEGNKVGDVWNIEQADPAHEINAGDNVAWNGEGWDRLAGTVDLTDYAHKSDVEAVDAKADTNAGDITALQTLVGANEADIEAKMEAANTAIGNLQSEIATKAASDSLSTVATSGQYSDLEGKPAKLSDFEDDLGSTPTHTHDQYLTEHQDISGKVDEADLAAVAKSGAYGDLEGTPAKLSEFEDDLGNAPAHTHSQYLQDADLDTLRANIAILQANIADLYAKLGTLDQQVTPNVFDNTFSYAFA